MSNPNYVFNEGKLSGLYDHLKEGVDYLDDIQRNKNKDE